MTKPEYLDAAALAALTGILARESNEESTIGASGRLNRHQMIAKEAYDIAQYMLIERDKRHP